MDCNHLHLMHIFFPSESHKKYLSLLILYFIIWEYIVFLNVP